MGGVPLHTRHISLAVRRLSGALALPDHFPKAVHRGVVCIVQGVKPVGQQLDRLAYAAWLVDAALLGDGQVHGQMQKRIAFAFFGLAHGEQGSIQVGQVSMVFGVLVNP